VSIKVPSDLIVKALVFSQSSKVISSSLYNSFCVVQTPTKESSCAGESSALLQEVNVNTATDKSKINFYILDLFLIVLNDLG